MSRIGKNPVAIPAGVDMQITGQEVRAKGKLGQLALQIHPDVEVAMKDGKIWVTPRTTSRQVRAHWGTSRALIDRMVVGVSKGYTVDLEINGVGFRAAVEGKTLKLQLGYSHDVMFPIPSDVQIKCAKPTAISISGSNKQRVGQVAAQIRAYRSPEPYKGKGIKYDREIILRKEGKKK
jgi:large subunit ribosomal protein L6